MSDFDIQTEQLKSDWVIALMAEGVIVDLSITGWKGYSSLKPEDLGLRFVDTESSDFMRRYVRLGNYRLLPPEVLRELEAIRRMAFTHLYDHSFKTVWGSFVPHTAFSTWQALNTQSRSRYLEAALAIATRYDQIVLTVKEEYRNLARDVWARLYPNDKGGPTSSYEEDYVTKIIKKIPPKEDILSSFRYEMMYYSIPLPSFMERNMANAQRIREESNLASETRRRIAEEFVERKTVLIDGFLESTVGEMRHYISELCENVLRAIGKQNIKGGVTNKYINKIKGMVAKVGSLNFYNDEEIATLLNDLDTEVNKFKGERNDDVIVDKLRKIADTAAKEFVPKKFNPTIDYLEV